MNVSKDSNLWGGLTLAVYVGAIGFMIYLYYRDSKKSLATWKETLDFATGQMRDTAHAMNGRVDERTARSTVEDYRRDDAESDATGI